MNTLSTKNELRFETESPISIKASPSDHHQAFDQHLQQQQQQQQQQQETATAGTSSQNQSAAKSPQEKVLN